MSNIQEVIEVMGEELGKLGAPIDVLASNGSIGNFLSGFIVTPRLVVSESLRDTEELESVIEYNLNIFGLMYSRVFDLLLTVYGMETKMALHTLGQGTTFALEDADNLGEEPDFEVCAEKNVFPLDISSASIENKSSLANKVVKEIELSAHVNHPETGRSMDIKVKMLMKATIVYTDPKEIFTAVDTQGKRISFGYRWDEYRSGAISLTNLIFSNDLLKEYKKNRIKEETDFMKYVESRRKANLQTLARRQTVNMSKMFQMLIVSQNDLKMIQKIVGGKMSKDRTKDAVLDSILSMSLTSVDDDHETVELFLNDISGNIEFTFRALKKGGASNNDEIIKWMMGQR